jgi:hypothetical protein
MIALAYWSSRPPPEQKIVHMYVCYQMRSNPIRVYGFGVFIYYIAVVNMNCYIKCFQKIFKQQSLCTDLKVHA